MKKYSTSKLLVAFLIVSLLSLPFCLAKGKPEPKPEPVWSVYIPVDPGSGLQGIGIGDETPICKVDKENENYGDCFEEDPLLPSGLYYVYDGNADGRTLNSVWTLGNTPQDIQSLFKFSLKYVEDSDPLQALFGISNFSTDASLCGDDSYITFCPEDPLPCEEGNEENNPGITCINDVIDNPQPDFYLDLNGDSGESRMFYLTFFSESGYKYDNDTTPWETVLANEYLYIDQEDFLTNLVANDHIKGNIINTCPEITRVGDDVWRISYDPYSIEDNIFLQKNISVTDSYIRGKKEIFYNTYATVDIGKGTIGPFEIYFVRTPQ